MKPERIGFHTRQTAPLKTVTVVFFLARCAAIFWWVPFFVLVSVLFSFFLWVSRAEDFSNAKNLKASTSLPPLHTHTVTLARTLSYLEFRVVHSLARHTPPWTPWFTGPYQKSSICRDLLILLLLRMYSWLVKLQSLFHLGIFEKIWKKLVVREATMCCVAVCCGALWRKTWIQKTVAKTFKEHVTQGM